MWQLMSCSSLQNVHVEAPALLITALCGGLVVLVLALRKWLGGAGSFPPGPLALPLIGHLHLLLHLPHRTLTTLSASYGPILGLRLGLKRGVVVSNPAMARQMLSTHDKVLANRPPYVFGSIMKYGRQNDISNNWYGPTWRKLRKLTTLELFTAKRVQELEHVRNEEIRALLQHIHDESSGGKRGVDIGHCVGHMTANIMMRLVCSKAGEDLHMLVREFEREAAPTVGDFIPWLKWLDFARKRQMRDVHTRLDKVLTAILEERLSAMAQSTVSASGPYEDLVHALLSKLHDANDDTVEDGVTMDEIKGVMVDVLTGGIHTTALTTEWAMAELLKNPHCMDRLQKEIGSLSKQFITESDIPKLSYLRCVVKEVLRLYPAAPLLVPRMASEELKVHNYILPAQTQVFVNVWAIGRDEELWHKANQFRPERFEDNETDVKGQHYELLPFGSGRRVCPGLSLGLPVVEGTLANLVNHFNWELPPGASMDMNEKRGLSLSKAIPVIALPKPRTSTF